MHVHSDHKSKIEYMSVSIASDTTIGIQILTWLYGYLVLNIYKDTKKRLVIYILDNGNNIM